MAKLPKLAAALIEQDTRLSEDMTPELSAIFQHRFKLTSVEKCWAGRSTSKSDEGTWLRAQGFTGGAMIPLGCAMGFLEPIP